MDGRTQTRVAPGRSKAIALFLCVFLFAGIDPAWTQPKYPQRIISMSPSITETLFALGVGDRVVGVTDFCSYPKEACTRTKIGGLLNPSVEAWITLKPDLIIHQEDSHKLKDNAQNLGIRTLSVSMTSLENIFQTIKTLGEELGCQPAARELVQKLQSGIQQHRIRLKDIPRKSTLLLLGDGTHPDGALYAVGPGTFLGELLALAGGDNILKNESSNYPTISREFILRHSPEIIIEAGPDANLSAEEKEQKLKIWRRFPTLTAVQNQSIHFIGADYILIPGPRFLNILDRFAQAIHPEAYED